MVTKQQVFILQMSTQTAALRHQSPLKAQTERRSQVRYRTQQAKNLEDAYLFVSHNTHALSVACLVHLVLHAIWNIHQQQTLHELLVHGMLVLTWDAA